MSEISPKKLRPLAERLFIEEGQNARAIAAELGLNEKTLSRWRKGLEGERSWDEKRAEFLTAPHRLKEILTRELERLSRGEEPSIDADALMKINKVRESLEQGLSLQSVYSVFKEFDTWMSANDSKMAAAFSLWHKKFLHHKALKS